MIIINAQHVHKSFGVHEVLKDVSFTLQTGQCLGLVGVNGSGKSTLLKILAGAMQPDDGTLSVLKGTRIGYLEQSWTPEKDKTVLHCMEDVFQDIWTLEDKMRDLERRLAVCSNEEELAALSHQYAKTTEQFEMRDGFRTRSNIQGVLVGLGFDQEKQQQPAASLSGGELTRLSLGKLLLEKPDVLLLDEPTNHLDLDTLKWLETYLHDYQGAVVLVSHDRYFLDAVCTDMLEILFGVSEQYRGNYTRYMEQRVERFESRERAFEKQQREIKRQQAIIERFRSFNREKSIRAAESREKKLAKMPVLERPTEEKQIRFSFEAKRRLGDDALHIENLSKSFDHRTLFSNITVDMKANERAFIIGPNGIGKTTLLSILMGFLDADAGAFRFGANADLGYYDQKQQGLDADKTILDEVWRTFPLMEQTEVRNALGLFLFEGDDVFAPVHTLSGGEKARVLLTKLMLRRDNFLILDEPTNHLDADSREMLEEALDAYNGTILSVSHDRYFINKVATKVLVMSEDGIKAYQGNYDDYQNELSKQNAGIEEAAEVTKTQIAKQNRKSREEQARFQRAKEAVKAAEKAVETLEERCRFLENQLMLEEVYTSESKAREVANLLREANEQREAAYRAWEQAEEEFQLL